MTIVSHVDNDNVYYVVYGGAKPGTYVFKVIDLSCDMPISATTYISFETALAAYNKVVDKVKLLA